MLPPRALLQRLALALAVAMPGAGAVAQPAAPVRLLVFPVPGLYEVAADGSIQGAGGVLLRRLAQVSKQPFTNEVLPVPRALQTLFDPTPACIVGVVRTPDREASLQWVGVVSRAELAVYGRQDMPPPAEAAPTLASLRGKRVVVVRDTAMAAQLREQAVRAQEVSSNLGALRMLQAGRVDYWFTHQLLAEPAASAAGGAPIRPLFSIARIDGYLACNAAVTPAAVEALREALQQLRRGGALAAFGLR